MATATLSNIRQNLSKIELSGLGIPFLVLLIISMLILPLPAFLLDFLFIMVILIFKFSKICNFTIITNTIRSILF